MAEKDNLIEAWEEVKNENETILPVIAHIAEPKMRNIDIAKRYSTCFEVSLFQTDQHIKNGLYKRASLISEIES